MLDGGAFTNGVTASTRWRDYVDIVTLGEAGLDHEELLRAVNAVADYRGVELQPIGSVLEGYGSVGQAKWATWRRKQGLTGVCEVNLDDQMLREFAAILDLIFTAQQY